MSIVDTIVSLAFLLFMLVIAFLVGVLRRKLMKSIKLWYLLLILIEYVGQYIVLAHNLKTGLLFQFIGAILNVVLLFLGSYINVIGITGKICSGKSTVMEYFKATNFHCISLDKIGHQILKRPDIIKKIEKHFGKNVLDCEGAINRKELGAIVFNNIKERRVLESITHPPIFWQLLKEIVVHKYQTKGGPICMEAALLLNSCLLKWISYPILRVVANDDILKERLMKRDNINSDEALIKIQANKTLKGADYDIDNSCGIEELHMNIQNSLPNYIFDI